MLDFNATQAAIRAGYSEKSARQTASENLSNPYIAKAVEEKQHEISERIGDTHERIDKEIYELYQICIEEVPLLNKNGDIVGYKPRNLSASAKCLELRCRRKGAFVNKAQNEVPNYVDILLAARPLIDQKQKKRRIQKDDN